MGMTPAEIRHVPIRRALWGYRRTAVEHLLDDCADSFEEVWRERADFADRIEHLEGELQRHRELETLLRKTLVSAEAAAQEQREGARRDAERKRLESDIRRLREHLRSALSTVDELDGVDEAAAA